MRLYNRFKTDQEIICKIDNAANRVGLYNLSCGGCMIEAPSMDAQEGRAVTVALNSKIEVPGQIVWRVDKNVGIRFTVPVHQKVVEHFGYANEAFDSSDPRDRFGIPLIEDRASAAGTLE